jgi:hypothetical protein
MRHVCDMAVFFCCREGHQRTTSLGTICVARALGHTCRTFCSRRTTCLRFGGLVGLVRTTTPTPSCLCPSSTSHSRRHHRGPRKKERPRQGVPREEEMASCYFGMSANNAEPRPRSTWLISTSSSRDRNGNRHRGLVEAVGVGHELRPKRIYFSEHFCCCFSFNLCVLNTTNTD